MTNATRLQRLVNRLNISRGEYMPELDRRDSHRRILRPRVGVSERQTVLTEVGVNLRRGRGRRKKERYLE
jgi:hypothetical protein